MTKDVGEKLRCLIECSLTLMKFFSKDKIKIFMIRNYQYVEFFLNTITFFVMNLKESNFENQQKL